MTNPINNSDEWETPRWLYNLLDEEFSFIMDICSTLGNNKCRKDVIDATKEWSKQINDCYTYPISLDGSCNSVFINPPYSNPGPFLERAQEYSKLGVVVCLVRDDPSTKWYQKLIQECTCFRYYCPSSLSTVIDCYDSTYLADLSIIRLPKRLKFERNGVPSKDTYNFPVCLIILDNT